MNGSLFSSIVGYWLESAKMFSLTQLGVYFKITAKSIFRCYLISIKRAWWMVLGLGCIMIAMLYIQRPCILGGIDWYIVLSWIQFYTVLFFVVLCMRPSVMQKRGIYFVQYVKQYGCSLFVFLLYMITLSWLCNALAAVLGRCELFFTVTMLAPLKALPYSLLSPVVIFYILFTCDTAPSIVNSFKNYLRAFIMVLLNLPFCFFLFACAMVGAFVSSGWILFATGSLQAVVIVFFLLSPIFVCFVGNYYSYLIRKQFTWYFTKIYEAI